LSLYRNLQRSLEPILGERTQGVLDEGIKRLGSSPETLDIAQAEVLLKRLVYRELQTQMSASAARAQIEVMLKQVGVKGKSQTVMVAPPKPEDSLVALETAFKRFNIYLEWPEVARMRGILNLIKRDVGAAEVGRLIDEGNEIIAVLEERLQSSLLRQSRDVTELKASLERVRSLGGPKVRRLETLLRDIQAAHVQDTLAVAEVERARGIAADLSKLVQSSVVQGVPDETQPALILDDPPPSVRDTSEVVLADEPIAAAEPAIELDFDIDLDVESLTAEQQKRIRDIDLAEERRRLESLRDRFIAVLGREGVGAELKSLEEQLNGGALLKERLGAFEEQLKAAQAEALTEARVQYEWLNERLRRFGPEWTDKTAPIASRLALVYETLQGGAVPQELSQLGNAVGAIEAEAKALLEAQERANRLRQQLEFLRSEAETSLIRYRQHPQVEAYLAGLGRAEPSESTLLALRQELSILIENLAKERQEESLQRAAIKAAVQALPNLQSLEAARDRLLEQISNPEAVLSSLAVQQQQLLLQAKSEVQRRLAAVAERLKPHEADLEVLAEGVKRLLRDAEQLMIQDRLVDPHAAERALEAAFGIHRQFLLEELSRFEAAANSLRGVGGEALLESVTQYRGLLQSGHLPSLAPLNTELVRARDNLEGLRLEVATRLDAILDTYEAYKSVGGETASKLKPLCDFLRQAAERLPRLGASGLSEVRRALSEADPLAKQLISEFQAAQTFIQDLKEADLDSLLDVFEVAPPPAPVANTPTPTGTPAPLAPTSVSATTPVSAANPPAPTVSPAAQATATAVMDQTAEASAAVVSQARPQPEALDVEDALEVFQMRGVEGVALLEHGTIIKGQLPIPTTTTHNAFAELAALSSDLDGRVASLAVIALPQSVIVLVPLKSGRGLAMIAEKAVLSRLLTQLEKYRSAVDKL
jgi:hypothetical protein